MRNLAIMTALLLAGACLDDPDDHSLGVEEFEQRTTTIEVDQQRCDRISRDMAALLEQRGRLRGCMKMQICLTLLVDNSMALRELEAEWFSIGCPGEPNTGPYLPR